MGKYEICRECGKPGCECRVGTDDLPPPCAACHRPVAACICKSHVAISHNATAAVDKHVQEAMRHYYNRDAEGLERFVRRLLK
jgi:hypothetical protein